MTRAAISLFLLLVISGCAPTVFVHSTKTNTDFERDKYECMKIAEQSACNWGSCGNPFMIANETRQCLQLKFGWQPMRQ